MLLHPLEGGEELGVAVAGLQADVDLAALRRASAPLGFRAGAGILPAAVLVDVGEAEFGIILVGIEDAVAVVHVDIDVGDAPQAVRAPQRLYDHADVAEHAESRRMIAAGMMQPADRQEGIGRPALHDPGQRVQRRAGHVRRGIEESLAGGRVAAVEKAPVLAAAPAHELHVIGAVKPPDLLRRGRSRGFQQHAVQARFPQRRLKHAVPVQAERVAAGPAVPGQCLSCHHQRGKHG